MFSSPLIGAHNLENLLLAVAMVSAAGASPEDALAACAQTSAPAGRLQPVSARPYVFVDYAHTPDGLARVLLSLRQLCARGRLICIFGAGGERDRGKRPLMGRAVADHADGLVVTSDNPRGEDPLRIIADILAGVPDGCAHVVEPDRGRAIRRTLAAVDPEDIVVIAGKGHERVQYIGSEAHPFDDVAVATEALEEFQQKLRSQ